MTSQGPCIVQYVHDISLSSSSARTTPPPASFSFSYQIYQVGNTALSSTSDHVFLLVIVRIPEERGSAALTEGIRRERVLVTGIQCVETGIESRSRCGKYLFGCHLNMTL